MENAKHELVAQELVRCRFNVSEVHREGRTGYSLKQLQRIRARDDVCLRLFDLLNDGAQALRIDVGIIKQELGIIGLSDITDVLACATVADIQALPPTVRRAIKKVKRKRRTLADQTVEETIEIELHNKPEALRLLALMEGALGNQGDPDENYFFAGINITILPPRGN